MKKEYLNTKTLEWTTRASVARQWHKQGFDIRVDIENDNDFNTKQIIVHGAHVETYQEKTNRENWEHCKRISDELETWVDGKVYRCPECGELLEINPLIVGDKYRCPGCETTNDIDDFEQQSLCNYFDDALDIEYTIGFDKSYRGVKIMVTCGGPNIYINTNTSQVELFWWGDKATYLLRSDVVEEIDACFEEYYNF